MDLSLLFTQTKTAINITKFIIDSQDTLDKSEHKLKLAELISTLADIKIETSEFKSEMIKKDEEIIQLKEQLQLKNDLVYDTAYYWLEKDDSKDGPFCQKCYDVDGKLVRLQGGDNDEWHCHYCKNYFQGKSYIYQDIDMGGLYT